MSALPFRLAHRPKASLLLCVLMLVLTGCSTHEQVLSSDPDTKQAVAILSDQTPPQPPADPAFAHITPLQVEASLRGLIVRPGGVMAFMLGDPQPFLSPEEVAWARDAIAPLLPKLRPDQRLQLSFLERFNHYPVVVQIYGQGKNLVYRFTKLSAKPPSPSELTGGLNKPLNYVTLDVQPGQSYSYDRAAYYLRDAILGNPEQAHNMTDTLAALEQGAKQRSIPYDELEPAKVIIHAHPDITPQTVQLYLDKLQLVERALAQGLFSPQEAAQRKQMLLNELRPQAASATKP